ncbi:hypothetical protein AB5I41_19235 [Sphingomonas sp. MMS24-JH45]
MVAHADDHPFVLAGGGMSPQGAGGAGQSTRCPSAAPSAATSTAMSPSITSAWLTLALPPAPVRIRRISSASAPTMPTRAAT